MLNNLSSQASISNTFLAQLRDINIQKDAMRFRRNLERIGEILAYEISKTLQFETSPIQTPLGIANINIPQDKIVLCPILRAGLPLYQGFLNYFDNAENAFISAYRKHNKEDDFKIEVEYLACPDLTNKTLIICDPMLATGSSIDATIEALKQYGQPKCIYLALVVASDQGIQFIREKHPDIKIWTAAIDPKMNDKSYIIPGLGDAGDLAFGKKIQR